MSGVGAVGMLLHPHGCDLRIDADRRRPFTGCMRTILARFWRWLVEVTDPEADHGTGPLLRCRTCRRVRRDIDQFGYCEPCNLREW